GESQVADRVEHLVAHELVGIAQACRIEDAIIGDDERVLERSAERIARAPQLGYVAHEAEGARPRELPAERGGLDIERDRLAADRLAGKLDLGLDTETVSIRS